MKKAMLAGVVCIVAMLSGCGLRFAATEAQKQNAYLHTRVCASAAQTAVDEEASPRLCALTELAQKQSEAFVLDYGLPQAAEQIVIHGQVDLDHDALDKANAAADAARADAARRPDAWTLADGAMELAIAVAGLLGGVYGARAARFLQKARQKSQALKEIVAGNELFKQLCPEHAERFKQAQSKQSPGTKQLVTELK